VRFFDVVPALSRFLPRPVVNPRHQVRDTKNYVTVTMVKLIMPY
jgi:hypothetical protein